MNSLIMNTPIVSINWLATNIDHPDLIILDASIKKITSNDASYNQNLQIKGARFFDIKKSFSDLSNKIPNMLAPATIFEENCRKLGIHSNTKIVIYDTAGIYSSARAWWMFTTMGYEDVFVLNGGLPAWYKAGLPTESMDKNTVYKTGNFLVNERSKCIVSSEEIKTEMNNSNTVIIDARSSGRFYATEPEPRIGLKGGHIPNSINLPYTHVVKNGFLKPAEVLKSIFEELDIENKKLIFTCGSGITACIILLAAKLAGYDNLSVYDGSWSEWGQLPNAPISC